MVSGADQPLRLQGQEEGLVTLLPNQEIFRDKLWGDFGQQSGFPILAQTGCRADGYFQSLDTRQGEVSQ